MFKIKPKTGSGFNETRPELGLEPNPNPIKTKITKKPYIYIYIYLVILLLIESGLGSSPSLG